jgi:hypothetical protein
LGFEEENEDESKFDRFKEEFFRAMEKIDRMSSIAEMLGREQKSKLA